MSEEQACPACGERWPPEHFTYSSGSPAWRACNACWSERYPRLFGPCAVCGLRVNTSRMEAHRDGALVHRRCRDLAAQDEKLAALLEEWERRGRRPNRYLRALP